MANLPGKCPRKHRLPQSLFFLFFFLSPLAKLAEGRVLNLYVLMSTSVGTLAQTALRQATFPDDVASNQARPFCARSRTCTSAKNTCLRRRTVDYAVG